METRKAIGGVLGIAVLAALFFAADRRSSRAPAVGSRSVVAAQSPARQDSQTSTSPSARALMGVAAGTGASTSTAAGLPTTSAAALVDDGRPGHAVLRPPPAESSTPIAAPIADDPESRRPSGWGLTDEYRYRVRADSTSAWHGALSARVELRAGGSGTTALMQTIRADDYRGKRVAFDVHVRTEGRVAIVRPWMRVDSIALGRVVAFDNAANQGDMNDGTSAWTTRTIVIDVPTAGDVISYGVILAGNGRLWVDAASLDVVGPETPATARPLAAANLQLPPRPPDPGRLARAPVNADFEQTVPIDPTQDR